MTIYYIERILLLKLTLIVGFFILKGKIIMINSANRKGTMFTLDEEVIKLLNQAKKETHVPKSQIVELALQEYLKDYKIDDDSDNDWEGTII